MKQIYTFLEVLLFARQIAEKELTETKEILRRKDIHGESVAHRLAAHYSTWTTNDPEILILYSLRREKSVEDLLEEKGKI